MKSIDEIINRLPICRQMRIDRKVNKLLGNMKPTFVDKLELTGKTIAKIVHPSHPTMENCDECIIYFTDNTYTVLESAWFLDKAPTLRGVIECRFLVESGLFTQEEADADTKAREVESCIAREIRDRIVYEELKAKFEKK